MEAGGQIEEGNHVGGEILLAVIASGDAGEHCVVHENAERSTVEMEVNQIDVVTAIRVAAQKGDVGHHDPVGVSEGAVQLLDGPAERVEVEDTRVAGGLRRSHEKPRRVG